MQLKKYTVQELIHIFHNKKVVVFGQSNHFFTFVRIRKDSLELNNIAYIVDNDNSLQGHQVKLGERYVEVKPPNTLKCEKEIMILVATAIPANAISIIQQLENMGLNDTIECCSLFVTEMFNKYDDSIMAELKRDSTTQINKIIHSFWFSNEKKPIEYQRCIDSWKKYCPEYQIIEWNSDNYDISQNKYMLQAYEKKRWAFVSDYARLDVVYKFGGIYLDMDVELMKSLNDLLYSRTFFSFDYLGYIDLGSGFGAVRQHPLVMNLLERYKNLEFEEDLVNEKYALPQPARLLPVFKDFGYKVNDKCQVIDECIFLSPDYFKVIDGKPTGAEVFSGSEYAIHWHNAGWWNEKKREQRNESLRLMDDLKKLFGY